MALDLALAQDWTAAGHAEPAAWYRALDLVGPWVALAVLALLVARSLIQAGRYRARVDRRRSPLRDRLR